MSDPDADRPPLFVLCRCGCGTPLPPLNKLGQPSRFAHGHNRRKADVPLADRRVRTAGPSRVPEQPRTVPCACGCGTMLPALNKRGKPSTYAHGHQNRGKKMAAEQRRKLSQAHIARADRLGRKDPTWRRHKDPRYKEWRLAVLERDAWTCQHCGHIGTPNEKGFAAHHILPYATHPEQRYDVANGQTLCRFCHMSLHGIALKPRGHRLCACGCGTIIPSVMPDGRSRTHVNGHSSKGRRKTDAQKKAISAAKKGTKASAETRAKMSAQRKGKRPPAHVLEASNRALRGKPRPDVAERNTQGHSPESRAKISAARKGQTMSDEARAKMSASRKGKPKSPETRAKMSEAAKRRHQRDKQCCN